MSAKFKLLIRLIDFIPFENCCYIANVSIISLYASTYIYNLTKTLYSKSV